jgi:hypothetical protein
MRLGLALSEKQIPQIADSTEQPKEGMELLESVGPRPRQARYQAALRPDMKYVIDSKVLSNFDATPKPGFLPQLCQNCAK